MPLSAGFLLMCRYNERSAERRVGGDEGMGNMPGIVPFWGFGLEPSWGDDACGTSEVEYLRSVLRRTFGGCVGCDITGEGAVAVGEGRVAMSGTVGSGYCTSNSRNGPQK